MSAPDPQLLAALLSAKAAIESALLALTKVEEPAAPAAQPAPAASSQPLECQHPKECRKDLPTFGTVEHWVCQLCGYEFRR